MYEQTLTQTGLTAEQSLVYEMLLKLGPNPARKIAQNTPYKRTLVYKILEDLGKLGLVTRKDEVGKVSVFEPAHPLKLKDLAEKKEQQAKAAQTALEGILGQLTSDFNLISGRPGVRYFEGIEGAKKVLADSLNATSEILSYIDNEAVDRYYPKVNEEYVSMRKQRKIKKRMIMVDSEYTKKHEKPDDPAMTDIRVIASPTPFATVMQIYDNKVSYISISADANKLMAAIIEHPNIAQMHKTLFESLWAVAKPLFSALPAAKPLAESI